MTIESAELPTSLVPRAAPQEIFKPSDAHTKLADVLIEGHAGSFLDMADKAGLSRSTLYSIVSQPEAVAWIVEKAAKTAKFGLAAVYARLLERALESRSSAWMKLFLEVFDPTYQSHQVESGVTHNTQFNIINGMSDQELRSFVEQKSRQVLGNSNGQ